MLVVPSLLYRRISGVASLKVVPPDAVFEEAIPLMVRLAPVRVVMALADRFEPLANPALKPLPTIVSAPDVAVEVRSPFAS